MSEAETSRIAQVAYRVGTLDAMLHNDVTAALNTPGVIRASLEGEREFRLQQLTEAGIALDRL